MTPVPGVEFILEVIKMGLILLSNFVVENLKALPMLCQPEDQFQCKNTVEEGDEGSDPIDQRPWRLEIKKEDQNYERSSRSSVSIN